MPVPGRIIGDKFSDLFDLRKERELRPLPL